MAKSCRPAIFRRPGWTSLLRSAPVTGLSTTMHFTNLLGMETAPHQIATISEINPGIPVDNGTITYQLLPNNLVRIERGEWPFMGGELILHETVLNFGTPSPKRLTFELQNFDAKQFVDSLGFSGIEITGTFDGVLPMIFDESGGRIVGGRLDSRPPGGELKYTGTKPAGLTSGIAFDLFSDIRYKSMIVRLNGDLAGEFATKLTIDGVSLGETHGLVAGLVHNVFSKLSIRLNVNIDGPFRALIQMAKAFKDPTEVIAPVMPFPDRFSSAQGRCAERHQERAANHAAGRKAASCEPATITWRKEVTLPIRSAARLALGIVAAASLNGCITVKAPDKPIDVNLNVNISQQVVVRLASDVNQMIQQNPQAFPPAPTHP